MSNNNDNEKNATAINKALALLSADDAHIARVLVAEAQIESLQITPEKIAEIAAEASQ